MLKGPISILEGNAGVQAIIGLNAAGDKYKVYPIIAPQTEKIPYVTLILTGKVIAGKGCGWFCTFDVRSYAVNYDDAEALDLACVAALNGGGNGTFNNVVMGYIQHENTTDSIITEPSLIYVKVSTFSTQVEE